MAPGTDESGRFTATVAEAFREHQPADLHERAMLQRVREAVTGHASEPVRIGRFEVQRAIGRGGMGVVYAVRDPNLSRVAALKLIPAVGAARREQVLQEARALARLEHPGIVRVYEADSTNDAVYIAMELVEGVPLRRWLTATRPPRREVLQLFHLAGAALTSAHDAEIVHGDFKPQNLLVTADGVAKVVDFGLARIGSQDSGAVMESMGDVPIGWTAAGAGTTGYMAPEQLRGQRPDARSDQFSFCVTLVEALAGQRPHPGATAEQVADAVLVGRLDEKILRRVPRRLRAALRTGLALDPANRFPSMTALLAALAPRRTRWIVAAAGCIALAALAITQVGPAQHTASKPAPVAAPINVSASDATDSSAFTAAVAVDASSQSAVGRGVTVRPDGGLPEQARRPPRRRTDAGIPAATTPKPSAPRVATNQRPRADRLADQDSPEMIASVQRVAASHAEEDGKPALCLRLLDQALALAPGPEGRIAGLTRARCEMQAGKCQTGTARYERVVLEHGGSSAWARQRSVQFADSLCPPTEGSLEQRVGQLRRMAKSTYDSSQCRVLLTSAEGMLQEATDVDSAQRKPFAQAMSYLAACFVRRHECAEAGTARAGYLRAATTMSEAEAAQAGADWATAQCTSAPAPAPAEPGREPYIYIPP